LPVVVIRDAVHFPRLINALHVGREASLKALRHALDRELHLLVVSQRDMNVEEPQIGDLNTVGTIAEVLNTTTLPDATLRVALRGLHRAEAVELIKKDGVFFATVRVLKELHRDDAETEALMRECLDLFATVVEKGQKAPPEALQAAMLTEESGHLADLIAHHLALKPAQKQQVLEALDAQERLRFVHGLLVREKALVEYQINLRSTVQRDLLAGQREYFLREQLKAIQSELAGFEGASAEVQEYQDRARRAGIFGQALAKFSSELEKLDRTPCSTPEGIVLRNYLDWLASLPWSASTEDKLDIQEARRVLDERHFALEGAKERILDYLAARKLNPNLKGAVLCFVGPPGVGKTSLGKSVAKALGRRFVSVSVGGLRDEAEIRGHRRTYVSAMPGRLIQGLRQAGSRNPVFMLDEIDKMGFDMRGDPAGALLEALDPSQNSQFTDHFIEVAFDLSSVLFIGTANVADTIPPALRDRLEIIEFSSYTREERVEVARRFLLPRQMSENGLKDGQIRVPVPTIEAIVDHYTMEAGVRELDRQVAALCRKIARSIVEGTSSLVEVSPECLSTYLGRPKYRLASRADRDEVGVATGLVVSFAGGDAITVEASLLPSLSELPQFTLTGNLGDVMKESAYTAATYIRSIREVVAPGSSARLDVHVHVPEGTIPKDGPSAGLTIAIALASALSGRPVRGDLAMTGEVTLRGRVLGVGGLREKALAAQRTGIRHVVIPKENAGEIEDLPASTRAGLSFHAVETVFEALEIALIPAPRAVVATDHVADNARPQVSRRGKAGHPTRRQFPRQD